MEGAISSRPILSVLLKGKLLFPSTHSTSDNGCVNFSTPNNSLILGGHKLDILQFNSDTLYLMLVHTSWVKWSVVIKIKKEKIGY